MRRLLVREDYGPDPARDALGRRIADQLPLLLLFFAAPFERTYLYGGEAPRWLSALALALELTGLWIALGARIQLGFFSWERRDGVEQRVLVRRGFYRFIRHPAIAGIFLACIAWPIAYGAPLSAILTIAIGAMVVRNSVHREERELMPVMATNIRAIRTRATRSFRIFGDNRVHLCGAPLAGRQPSNNKLGRAYRSSRRINCRIPHIDESIHQVEAATRFFPNRFRRARLRRYRMRVRASFLAAEAASLSARSLLSVADVTGEPIRSEPCARRLGSIQIAPSTPDWHCASIRSSWFSRRTGCRSVR